jgi:hypothetical protein
MRNRSLLLLCLSLTLAAGCDNVSWGGADVVVVSPPPPRVGEADEPLAPGATVERLPEGAVLYYVVRDTAGASMIPVAEIREDSMLSVGPLQDPAAFGTRFIGEHMRQGAEFPLFSRGVRVGTFILQSAEMQQPGACPLVPRARGSLELLQGAEQNVEFLALARADAPQVPRSLPTQLQPTGRMQVMAPILAERVMRAERAGLPGNWQRAMAQLQPFPHDEDGTLGFATTFLVGDTLAMGRNNEGHSTFLIARTEGMSFATEYVDFANYAQTGKRAPRVVDFLDWDRSGLNNLLLQVYSVDQTWFEAVGRGTDRQWRRILDGRCR